jgi:predicted O-methyltransferase YrrM
MHEVPVVSSLLRKLGTAASILATAPTWRARHLADVWRTWRASAMTPLDPPLPWLSWPCIDWLDRYVRPGMRVFEYGGGGSTLYFLARGCEVTTVEGNLTWTVAIGEAARAYRSRLRLRFIDSQNDTPTARRQYADAALDAAPWDLILVDGAFRRECVLVARRCIVPGGVIIVDNTDMPEYAEVHPEEVLRDFERRVFRGLGFARVLPTTTEVYTARRSA